MKKLLGIVVLGLLLSTSASFSGKKDIGKGELKLENWLVEYFHEYIQGQGGKHPGTFVVAIDGSYATYWYCTVGINCAPTNEKQYTNLCEDDAGVECKVFARQRSIRWLNGINPGKGKISQINSKLDLNGLKAKLTELGFYGNTTTTKKIEKKETKKIIKKKIEKKETKKTDSKKQKAKDECKELGFTKGTEKFGDCVMKMLSM